MSRSRKTRAPGRAGVHTEERAVSTIDSATKPAPRLDIRGFALHTDGVQEATHLAKGELRFGDAWRDCFHGSRLGTLADAGKALPVHVLLPGSPAQNTGAPSPNDGSTGHCESTDQRGIQRQQCDRGAFEGRVDYTVDSTADAPDSNPGNGSCFSTIGGARCARTMEPGTDTPILTRFRRRLQREHPRRG